MAQEPLVYIGKFTAREAERRHGYTVVTPDRIVRWSAFAMQWTVFSRSTRKLLGHLAPDHERHRCLD